MAAVHPIHNDIPIKERFTGEVPWLKIDPGFKTVELEPGGTLPNGMLKALTTEDLRRPVFDVTYPGALAYCQKMGKELPRKAEWQAAARGPGSKYPWGDEFNAPERLCANKKAIIPPFPIHPVGGFASSDRSGIGCVDMAGNVAEWCEEFDDDAKLRRRICGGSFNDDIPELFEITRHRNQAPGSAEHWIGFRGVVRIPISSPGP